MSVAGSPMLRVPSVSAVMCRMRGFPPDLPNGPFQITKYVSYGAHTGDPVHRFFHPKTPKPLKSY